MTFPYEIAGAAVITADVKMPYIGIWYVDLEASTETAIAAAQTLTAKGVSFVGTILRSTVIGGRCKLRMVGGAGKFTTVIPARHWANSPSVGTIVKDALAACGETISTTVDPDVLALRLPQWKRNQEAASRALQSICDNQGLIWRVLRDGTVWIGLDEYPVVAPTHVLIDEDWSAGVIDIAPEAPDLLPGTTFRDQRIRYVCHYIRSALRTEACLEPPGGLLDRFLAGVRQEIQYSRSFPARVVAQNPDGTLQVVPDDEKMKGTGLNRVPIRTGLPGFKCTVTNGAKVSIEFENGDPSKPRASLWSRAETLAHVTAVEFEPGGVSSPVVRVGDRGQGILPAGIPVTGLLSGAPFVGVITVSTPLTVVINSGNAKLLA